VLCTVNLRKKTRLCINNRYKTIITPGPLGCQSVIVN
jgi:hypothetical protein